MTIKTEKMSDQINLMLQDAIKALQTQNYIAAELIAKEALNIQPNHQDIKLILAIIYASQGNHSSAIAIYSNIIANNPRNVSALSNLGVSLSSIGMHQQALTNFERALKINPTMPEAYFNAANTICELKEPTKSIPYYERAIQLNPNYIEAYNNFGRTLIDLNRFEEALDIFNKAIELNPDFLESILGKADALNGIGRYEEAITFYDRALEMRPGNLEIWVRKGNVESRLRLYERAINSYDKVLSMAPEYAEILVNKGICLFEKKHIHQSIELYDKALKLKPEYAEAWANKGTALIELKQYNEGVEHYKKAYSLNPRLDKVLGEILFAKMMVGQFSDLDQDRKEIIKQVNEGVVVISPFTLLPLFDDPALHLKAATTNAKAEFSIETALERRDINIKSKIRIGYFSGDFYEHPVSYLTSELFELHDRDHFEIIAFSLREGDPKDAVRTRLEKSFDKFINVENYSDKEIAMLARDLEIDIAVDLSGLTKNSRTKIFQYRAAPLQVNWLGYCGTIGANFMDYILADPIVIPEDSSYYYVEKVIHLPHTMMVDDSKRIPSTRRFDRSVYGLPDEAFVFCCFNNSYKFNMEIVRCWSRILKEVECSILWVAGNNLDFKKNISSEFMKCGIEPSRIVFAEREPLMEDHLARLSLADLFLDTFPYNAHTTALDSLKAGVPILSLQGRSFAGRVAASILTAINLSELIAHDKEEYVSMAISLASDKEKLNLINTKLEANINLAPLFNAAHFAKNIEKAYIKICERYNAGLEPDFIKII